MYYYDKKSLQFKQISIKQYIYTFVLFALIFSSMGFGVAIKTNNIFEKIPVIIRSDETFSPEEVRKEIIRLNLAYPDIVYAQCIIESNSFKSNIFKNNNNCLGMKLAKSRPTTAISEDFEHAKYENWKDCIKDYALWQASYARNLSKEQYLQLLSEIYAEDNNYKNKLIKLIN